MLLHRLARTLCVALLGLYSAATLGQNLYATPGAWLDDANRPYRWEQLRGSLSVVSMAYGACRRVCSTSLRMLEQIQALADERKLALNFIVVGLDPGEDRPEDWAAFRTERRLNRANWHFLSGAPAETARVARLLGVRTWRYGEHIMHDLRIVLVSGQGKVLTALTTPDQRLDSLLSHLP